MIVHFITTWITQVQFKFWFFCICVKECKWGGQIQQNASSLSWRAIPEHVELMLHLKNAILLLFLAVCYFIVMFTSTSDAIVSRRLDIGKLNNNNNNIHHRLNIYDNRRRELSKCIDYFYRISKYFVWQLDAQLEVKTRVGCICTNLLELSNFTNSIKFKFYANSCMPVMDCSEISKGF